MNKLLIKIIIAMLALASFQYAEKTDGEFYFGVSEMPIEVSGLEEVHLSDYQSFPVATSISKLDLSKGNRDGLATGFNLGFKTNNNIPLLLEAQLYPEDALIANLLLGLKIYILNTDIFQFGLSPKVGFSIYYHSLGKLQDMGYSWVDLNGNGYKDSEDPRVGDSISATMLGGVAQATADFRINFTKHVGLLFSAGISNAMYGDLQFSIDRNGEPINIDISDPAVVEPGTTNNPNLDPEIKAEGLYYNVSLVLNF